MDAASLASPAAPHMRRLILSFPDSSHLVQEWTSTQGAQEHVGRFEFTRKK